MKGSIGGPASRTKAQQGRVAMGVLDFGRRAPPSKVPKMSDRWPDAVACGGRVGRWDGVCRDLSHEMIGLLLVEPASVTGIHREAQAREVIKRASCSLWGLSASWAPRRALRRLG